MKTANLSILFSDIHGFTERTGRQSHEETQRLLQAHADLATPLFAAFGGEVVKAIGDAFIVSFESPTQAVLCGIALQDRLWHHAREAPEAERHQARVGINVGEVRVRAGDIFGEPVNIAARVHARAAPGEVLFTEAVYLAMNKAEVPAAEVGAFELKGIPGRVRVFRVPPGPYRVEGARPTPAPDSPPYGNLGLDRVDEATLRPGALRARPGASLVAAVRRALGGRGRVVGGAGPLERLGAALERRGVDVSPRVLLGGLALVLLAALALPWLLRSPAERAIDRVADADAGRRPLLAEEARGLIAREADAAGRRELLEGRLQEALGTPGRAIGHYREAVRRGSDAAGDRLVALLEDPECKVRAAAADAAGELGLRRARGALEDLAEAGGPNEGSVPLFGCNSRRAAEGALRRLEQMER